MLGALLARKGDVERETGLEPATFSLEGLSDYAQWHPSWEAEHFVSSYRLVKGSPGRAEVPLIVAGSALTGECLCA
jgi:hypothetical protein